MSRKLANEKLENLLEIFDAQTILEHIVNNYLSGSQALEALSEVEKEFGGCDSCYTEEDDEHIDEY